MSQKKGMTLKDYLYSTKLSSQKALLKKRETVSSALQENNGNSKNTAEGKKTLKTRQS